MNTTTQQPGILDLLQMSYLQYDNYRDHYFNAYCQALAKQFYLPARRLSQNDYLLNYFYDMWQAHVEKAFLKHTEPYAHLCEPKLMRDLLDEFAKELISGQRAEMYPKSILKEIRKELQHKTLCN